MGFVCRLLWSHPVKWKRFLYSVFCLCNPHVMWILSWYLELTRAPAKNSDAQTLLEGLILKDIFFQHYSCFFWDMIPFVGVRAPQIPRDPVLNEYSQHSQKLSQREASIFALSLSFSARFTTSVWGLFSNCQSQLKYPKNPDIHSHF